MTRRRLITLVVVLVLLAVLTVVWFQFVQPMRELKRDVERVAATRASGFGSPYLLYVPAALDSAAQSESVLERARLRSGLRLLVVPNNTGQTSDDAAMHEAAAYRLVHRVRPLADELGVPLLVPAFPRPASHDRVYTHALDRDVFVTGVPELRRLDLQLVAMIDDARRHLAEREMRVEPDVLMVGFSASGMFVNRFALLHPTRVRAAAIGSPGGWPIAPHAVWEGALLRYPVGIADVEELAGWSVDLEACRAVEFFFFLGNADENDSVPYDDGYEDVDEELVFRLFGDTPVERWGDAEKTYVAAGFDAEFRLYDGIAHDLSPEMLRDVTAFLANAAHPGRVSSSEPSHQRAP